MRRVHHVLGDGPGAGQRGGPQTHVVELAAGVDGVYPIKGCGRCGINPGNDGMSHRGAHHAHPQLSRSMDVIDVAAFAG